MRDRTKVITLSVVTVPLAWYALAGGPGGGTTGARPPLTTPLAVAGDSQPVSPRVQAPPAAGPSRPSSGGPVTDASDAAVTPIVQRGAGTTVLVPGGSAVSGHGRVVHYTVRVEQGLGVDPRAFAAQVDRTLADPRSRGHGGARAFQRVDSGPVDVEVVLASPDTADRLCRPLDTAGTYSCGVGRTAVLNSMRWLRGADAYTGRLAEYRQYVVNHEVGHTLGHGHEQCRTAGAPAPVMVQQTKGVGACLPSPWPFP